MAYGWGIGFSAKATDYTPQVVNAYRQKAMEAERKRQQEDAALEKYRSAIKLDPEKYHPFYYDKVKDAMSSWLNDVATAKEKFPLTYKNHLDQDMVGVQQKLGSYERASQSIKEYNALDPKQYAINQNLIDVFNKKKNISNLNPEELKAYGTQLDPESGYFEFNKNDAYQFDFNKSFDAFRNADKNYATSLGKPRETGIPGVMNFNETTSNAGNRANLAKELSNTPEAVATWKRNNLGKYDFSDPNGAWKQDMMRDFTPPVTSSSKPLLHNIPKEGGLVFGDGIASNNRFTFVSGSGTAQQSPEAFDKIYQDHIKRIRDIKNNNPNSTVKVPSKDELYAQNKSKNYDTDFISFVRNDASQNSIQSFTNNNGERIYGRPQDIHKDKSGQLVLNVVDEDGKGDEIPFQGDKGASNKAKIFGEYNGVQEVMTKKGWSLGGVKTTAPTSFKFKAKNPSTGQIIYSSDGASWVDANGKSL